MSEAQHAEIVIARAGETPTRSNSVPLEHSGVGRCSLVLYSPATMYSTVGFEENTLHEVIKAGGNADVDWESEVPRLFPNIRRT